MDEKTILTLEYPKVLERLADYAAFSASAELARALRPTNDLKEALHRQARTTQAARLLSVKADISIGGAVDIRPLVERARRYSVLTPSELLEIKGTLYSARELAHSLARLEPGGYAELTELTEFMPPPPGLIEAISRCISDRADILDNASPKLGTIRSQIKVAHERILSRLQKMLSDPHLTPHLQDSLITTRDGRYVIPLRAESRRHLRAVVHDQSSSGATLFVEPLAVVELNNEWHELQLAEKEEERRILAELSALVGNSAERLILMVAALAQFDLALSCAKYAEDLRAVEPVLVDYQKPPRENHPGSTINLMQARHPLLDQSKVVPLDITFDDHTFALVITGPNTGGKTVTLKTVGLLSLMAQSGLHIPARSGSSLSIFEDIFADIGDEQSIEQSLSTFSGHVTNIKRILHQVQPTTLVLFDELGAGTDPQEGSALARAILTYLLQRRIPCLVATHYPELKTYAHTTPGVVNASLEFDLRTLRPTYHLIIGLPGRSNALAISERLGLPAEIIEEAKKMVSPTELRADDLLDEIHFQRKVARQQRSAADRSRGEADSLRSQLSRRLENIEDERLKILEKARRDAEKETEELRAEIDQMRKALARARQPLDAIKEVQQAAEQLQEKVDKPLERQTALPQTPATRPLKLGDKVRLRTLQMNGVVTAIGQEDVEVQLGNLRLRAKMSDIQRPGDAEPAPEAPAAPAQPTPNKPRRREPEVNAGPSIYTLRESPGMEIDLRGQRAEDALEMLDRYLESAFLSGMPFVRIIHGKGTGKLRQSVREALRVSSYIKSFETGQEKEGGDGVTIARLAHE